MLLSFTFKNFRSFRDEKTLSMEAGSIKELGNSVIHRDSYRLLPAAVIYGANSSGKSNVLLVLLVMKSVVLGNVKLNPNDELYSFPFMLDLKSPNLPTVFEIQFLIDGVRYRYGFEYDRKRIYKEWLYEKNGGQREFNLFLRVDDEFDISKTRFPEGIGKEGVTSSNRLFVSLVAQLNGVKSTKILDWFRGISCMSEINNNGNDDTTFKMLHDHIGNDYILDFFHRTKLGFNDIIVVEKSLYDELEANKNELPDFLRTWMVEKMNDKKIYDVKTTHNIYDENGNVHGIAAFKESEMESEGTKKIIKIIGPIVYSFIMGNIVVIDELDAKLHPFLTRHIVQLFMDPKINVNGAQLIFTTHDTNLLNLAYLRRDQIWFTEKDKTESSDLYSLVEFKDESGSKVRNDRSVEKDYINGRYGAIPFMN